jgi:hypothetical protein
VALPNAGGKGSYLLINRTRSGFDYLSTAVHEFGHRLGIAHSSVGMFNSLTGSYSTSRYSNPISALDVIAISKVPTMHPFSTGTGTSRQQPKDDDIAFLREHYPDASPKGGTVTGKVTRLKDDSPVKNANVRLVNDGDTGVQISRYSSGADGKFTFNGVPAGTYRVVVEPMGYNNFIPDRMAIDGYDTFAMEYYSGAEAEKKTEELPDTPQTITVTEGGTASGIDVKVETSVKVALVIDDTGSMSGEIASVKKSLKNFILTLTPGGEEYPMTAFYTFKDDVTHRITTTSSDRLLSVADSLYASGGGETPEASNAALIDACQQLGP